ncbi:GNAT family N-acetyltransferase [Listeria grandensis]|uniref:N-acetyltransferase GCN5 n=2 Tax=Listeria grandensis TaxID=1494963 RepID=W7B7T4_9LIST|nr:GNAT family N-acetyltransferase [Listeria grandensis]EUJ23289.1 N-acetyltransferase GCN5 [Listeria grandensis FSL F6-0971]MBC1475063.1 GNAT family N-acetyltransferase [Listeria grandensis]MBC1937028.1 GNAT family N-acetyltransferase [Listeria grandensis]
MIIRKLPLDKWEKASEISVFREQKVFVDSVADSLIRIDDEPDDSKLVYNPYGIYAENELVGFILYTFEEESKDNHWISGFVIDKDYQHQGIGRRALEQLVDFVFVKNPESIEVKLAVSPENLVAKNLFLSVGFKDAGWKKENKEVLCFKNKNPLRSPIFIYKPK